MKQKDVALALVVLGLMTLLGSGFFLPTVSAYVPVAAIALGILLMGAALTRQTLNPLRAGALALLCGGPVLLSGLVNGSDPERLIAPAAFLAFALAAYWVGRALEPGDLRKASVVAAASGACLMVLAIFVRHWDLPMAIRTGNRFFADPNQFVTGMNPTVIGLMAMAIFIAALASSSLRFVLGVGATTGLMVLAVSSRSALLTMFVALGASQYLMRRRSAGVLVLAALGGVFLLLVGLSFFGEAFQGVANALFLVQDAHRGLASGSSGRAAIWSYFYQNWLDHPVFGAGPGTAFQTNGASLYSHNMLLQILTDGGLISLVSFVIVLAAAIAGSRRIGAEERRIFFTTLLAYFVYGIFEGRAINIGNPMSAYFYFVTFAVLGMSERASAPFPARAPPIYAQSDLSRVSLWPPRGDQR